MSFHLDNDLIHRQYPKHDSAQIITVKINSYYKHIDEVRNWYSKTHMNYDVIKVEKSKWWVWNEVLELANTSVDTIQVSSAEISNSRFTPTRFIAY